MENKILCYSPSSCSSNGLNLAFRLKEEGDSREVLEGLGKTAREMPLFNFPVNFIGEVPEELATRNLNLFDTFFGANFGTKEAFPPLLRVREDPNEGTLILFRGLTGDQAEAASKLVEEFGLKGEWLKEEALESIFS